jgi:putative acetyltransferase
MEIKIRPLRFEDSYQINDIRTMRGVFENLPSLYSERPEFIQNFIKTFADSDHAFVAEVFENNYMRILGMAGLHINRSPRIRHSAMIGVMVHPGFQRRGIGKRLIECLIDTADNWVQVKRIELEVISDNTPAINLYKKFGFEQEGIKKKCVFRNGEYKDAIMMARYKF